MIVNHSTFNKHNFWHNGYMISTESKQYIPYKIWQHREKFLPFIIAFILYSYINGNNRNNKWFNEILAISGRFVGWQCQYDIFKRLNKQKRI